MNPERHPSRRRFLAGLAVAATLAGCADENGSTGGGDEGGEEGGADDESAEDPEGDNESGAGHGAPEDGGLDVEGTNLFVRVVDGTGLAIEGATVTVSGGAIEDESFTTDADGRVIRRGVEPGEYAVTAAVGDREDRREVSLAADDDESLTFTFETAPSEGGDTGSSTGNESGTDGSNGTNETGG
ncbi:carboxypeptidase-like regulatory domain-containing protein [Halalkalicoccus jeotgali]|uniref:Carboxypeptidase regulatory-like domain-containing protein n=1 Tax=Halalkalicoccus jeotgali (strain DSM 18796 / CECT 7217 / JCM 14584 / KCTC 4019 / B3) TaxID=795797 RepID=D8J862_HALJB|nr:carboxypeptidase-like regulatory domain-containing protein [Halalkalicoccus jeotgali]ADJ14175.1 hypothetical protein HacjB3_03920 [Halalkalicoccus jeotgali B3]ELY34643.1 hypothetical protein C497_15373 [Halalkalicoccus jeotgali B3]